MHSLPTSSLPLSPLCLKNPLKITGQCPDLPSFPRFLRQLWRNIWIRTTEPGFPGDIGIVGIWLIDWLNSHINSSNISNHYQSAYRKFHSTETALKIHNDILWSIISRRWLCSTFPLPLIPLSTLSFWEDLMIGLGLLGRHLTGLNHIWLEDARGLS